MEAGGASFERSAHGQMLPEIVSGAALTIQQRRCFSVAHHNRVEAMALRIRLPGGTLKMKLYRELRDRERDRRVPVMKMGSVYFIWWSNNQAAGRDDPGRERQKSFR